MAARMSSAGRYAREVAFGICAFAVLGGDAAGQSETGQLTVSATVLSGCTLIGGTLNFGTYISGQQAPLDASGQIGYVNCSGRLTFELDGGQEGNVNARKMNGPDGKLSYQIYQTSTRNSIWGSGGNAYVLNLLGATPSSGDVTVHGRIPGGQTVPGGTYTDIVNITLTF